MSLSACAIGVCRLDDPQLVPSYALIHPVKADELCKLELVNQSKWDQGRG